MIAPCHLIGLNSVSSVVPSHFIKVDRPPAQCSAHAVSALSALDATNLSMRTCARALFNHFSPFENLRGEQRGQPVISGDSFTRSINIHADECFPLLIHRRTPAALSFLLLLLLLLLQAAVEYGSYRRTIQCGLGFCSQCRGCRIYHKPLHTDKLHSCAWA